MSSRGTGNLRVIQTVTFLFFSTLFTQFSTAETISGTVLIKKQLTHKSVTASVSLYQRESPVPLGEGAPGDGDKQDPLVFERSRVVVWIEDTKGTVASKSGSVAATMQQVGRRFSPDLVVVPAGSAVAFPNGDPIFHNVFSLSKPKLFDLGNYPRGDSRSVTFGKPGIVYVNCHLHPNMAASIVVTPNNWFARLDKTGQFIIADIPPGVYSIVAWHKSAGFFRKTVQVAAERGGKIDFFIPIGDPEPPARGAEK